MSITPSSGRRGTYPLDSTSPRREESIQRLWSFLSGLQTKNLRIYGESSTTGQALVAQNSQGNVTFSSVIPSTTVSLTGQTANQTATLVASASGEYIVTVYMECTSASAGTGVLYSSISYTDDVSGPITVYPTAGIATSAVGRDGATLNIRCSGGGIDYAFAIVGTGSPTYSGYISITQVR